MAERQVPVVYEVAGKKAGTAYTHMVCVHVRRDDVPSALQEAMRLSYNETLAQGDTYPYLDAMDSSTFESYFFGHDAVVGILVATKSVYEEGARVCLADMLGVDAPLSTLLRDHVQWPTQLGGFYYIKPNYPGRSAHICNAGFVVPTHARGIRLGSALGRSYLAIAPALGYLASVFNLVYATNQASAKIWERLGFDVVGRIPKAGRLRLPNTDGDGYHEEYVDALVIYKEFAKHIPTNN